MMSSWLKRMLRDVQQQMWDMYLLTGDLGAAAAAIGVSRWTVQNWVIADGGIAPAAVLCRRARRLGGSGCRFRTG